MSLKPYNKSKASKKKRGGGASKARHRQKILTMRTYTCRDVNVKDCVWSAETVCRVQLPFQAVAKQ